MRRAGLALIVAGVLVSGTAAADPYGEGRKWGIGLRSTSLGVAPEDNPDQGLTLGGGGWQVRYRMSPRWSLELTLENVSARADTGAYERISSPVTLSGLWHLTPHRRLDWYLIFGVGGTADEVTYRRVDGSMASETFAETHVHLGVGVERQWRRVGLGAELRAVGLAREDEDGAGATYAGRNGPIPVESSGTQFNLTFTYYF